MLWDQNFWEEIIVHYFSDLAVSFTLLALGLGGYEVYVYRRKRKKKKVNKIEK